MSNNNRQIIVCSGSEMGEPWAELFLRLVENCYIFHKHARRLRQVGKEPTTDCEGARTIIPLLTA